MRLVLPLVAAAGLLVGPAIASARPADADAVRSLLAEDRAAGRIDAQTWLLQSFRAVFAPERVEARYEAETRTLLVCFTPEIAEYQRLRSTLTPEVVAELDGYLSPAAPGLRATYISPGGRFQLTYFTTGPDAVPTADVNPPNGIPDFVERCAEYMDISWAEEIDTIGFLAPLLPGDGTYDVGFQSMGAYGYTTISGATTRIVLHNTFLGFPPNTDPDGRQLGAAKVTCAHEFKHASQYTTSGWSEGGWVELDATWAEDIVFPLTNDYWNYVNNNGPNILGQPWTPLDDGGAGSYEDCLWQHWMSGSYGNQIIVDFWELRDTNPAAAVKSTYQQALGLYGTTWDEGYPGFLEWAWFTGSRAAPPFGFPDAPNLMRMNLRGAVVTAYPSHLTDNVVPLAGHPWRFNPGAGYPRVQVDGPDGFTNMTVSVILEETAGSFTIVRPALDASNRCDYLSPLPWSSLQYVGVIVTNSRRSPGDAPYTLDVTDESAPVGAPLLATGFDRLVQEAPSPNPTSGEALVRFALPREGRVTLRILDVAGRVVRTVVDRSLPAGAHEVAWDGRDAAGRPVAAGLYWSRVESGDTSVTRKITVLR